MQALVCKKTLSWFKRTPSFFRYFRMTPDRFEYLLELVCPKIEKKNTRLRRAVPPRVRLAIRLRYLVSGETQQSLPYVIFIFIFFHIHLAVLIRCYQNNSCRLLPYLISTSNPDKNFISRPLLQPKNRVFLLNHQCAAFFFRGYQLGTPGTNGLSEMNKIVSKKEIKELK